MRAPVQPAYGLDARLVGGGAGVAGGYDNPHALNQRGEGRLTFAASAYEPTSGRVMEVWSTEPGMQSVDEWGSTT